MDVTGQASQRMSPTDLERLIGTLNLTANKSSLIREIVDSSEEDFPSLSAIRTLKASSELPSQRPRSSSRRGRGGRADQKPYFCSNCKTNSKNYFSSGCGYVYEGNI
jgi:hypothetical protein